MKKGFTLIEILITIAIMAVLIGLLMPNFIGVRIRARDARRKSDLSQIKNALELFKSDQDPPSYPADNFMSGLCSQCWSQNSNCTGNIYMRKLPCDPQTQNIYYYSRNAADTLKYTLFACLENSKDDDRDNPTQTTCANLGKVSYTVYEP